MMKRYIFTLILLVAAVSCDRELESQEGLRAVRLEMWCENHYDSDCQSVKRTWQAEDTVAMAVVSASGFDVYTAAPVMEGRNEGLFMFDIEGLDKGQNMVAFFPHDAEIDIHDGMATAQIPELQNGQVNPVWIGSSVSTGSTYLESDIAMKPYWCTIIANVSKGDYSICKAVMKSKGGEGICGDVRFTLPDMTAAASEPTITVELATPVDCRTGNAEFPILVAPVTLSQGFTISFTTEDGRIFEYENDETTHLEMGEAIETDLVGFPTELLICGNNMIYRIDADKAFSEGFENAVTWQWDAESAASIIGGTMTNIDECKPVNGNSMILATSSYNWAALIDADTKELLWWTYGSKNAHSAEYLPGNRIAVACSNGEDDTKCNRIQIFDVDKPNQELYWTPLKSAHGVVWNPANQRLYAIGGSLMNIYSLTDWDTDSPSLKLVECVNTSSVITGLHDLTLVDDNTLLLAGKNAVFYNIRSRQFSGIPYFSTVEGLKSVNYSTMTGECWYTMATEGEGTQTWSTQTIRYTDNINGNGNEKTIFVPEMDMYKVRVFNW